MMSIVLLIATVSGPAGPPIAGPLAWPLVHIKWGQVTILDQTSKGKWHGHVRSWNELTQQQRNAPINAGLTDKPGQILPEEK